MRQERQCEITKEADCGAVGGLRRLPGLHQASACLLVSCALLLPEIWIRLRCTFWKGLRWASLSGRVQCSSCQTFCLPLMLEKLQQT